MKKIGSLVLVGMAVITLVLVTGASAQDKKEKKLPRSGMLSSSTTSAGAGAHRAEMPWGEDGSGGNAPVEGSVSKVSGGDWMMRLINGSKDSYNVDVSVVQKDARGTSLKTDHFSYSLRGGQSAERRVSAALNAANAELRLDGWKKSPAK